MNYRGSSRKLFGNSVSAMVGAIEIYNKPRFAYRDEVFSILLVNAWELLLKAIVSKSGGRIFYPKKRGEPYKTLSCRDAFWRAANSKLWPKKIEMQAVDANIELLSAYRDSAVHFYNDDAFSTIFYSLAQTSINNYRDVAVSIFGKDLADEITWRIMPLGLDNPIDPVRFMRGDADTVKKSRPVQEFLAYLKQRVDELEAESIDTGRLLTVFDVSLQSVKKIDNADITVGVTAEDDTEAIVVNRRVDPNVTHPHREKDILRKVKGQVTSHTFRAIVDAHELRGDQKYWWKDKDTNQVKWSPEVIKYIDRLNADEITAAVKKYKERFKRKR